MVKQHFWPNAVEQEERWEKVFLSIYSGGKKSSRLAAFKFIQTPCH